MASDACQSVEIREELSGKDFLGKNFISYEWQINLLAVLLWQHTVKISVLIFHYFDNVLHYKLLRFWLYLSNIFLATKFCHKLNTNKLKRKNSSQAQGGKRGRGALHVPPINIFEKLPHKNAIKHNTTSPGFLTTPSTPLKKICQKKKGPPLDFQLLCTYVRKKSDQISPFKNLALPKEKWSVLTKDNLE
jgi:hypothetical protein